MYMCKFFFQVTGSYFSSGLDREGWMTPDGNKIEIKMDVYITLT